MASPFIASSAATEASAVNARPSPRAQRLEGGIPSSCARHSMYASMSKSNVPAPKEGGKEGGEEKGWSVCAKKDINGGGERVIKVEDSAHV